MKIIATGDQHFDEHGRWDDCLKVHAFIADLVERERPAVFLSGGDVYERASTPRERAAVADWLVRIADVCPVVIAKGNHDRQLDCAILGRLRSTYPIIVEEAAAVHVAGGVAVAAVAWPDRSRLLSAAGDDGAEGANEIAQTALRSVLLGLGAELAAHDGPRVLLGHFMIDGSVTSTGQPMLGHAMNVSLSDLGLARAEITIAAHIHQPQAWEFDGRPILYTGSPYRTTFGELEQKSVTVAEFDGAKLTSWRRIETPSTPMVHLDATVDAEAADLNLSGPVELVPCAEVRLRYVVDADQRELGKLLADEWKRTLLGRDAVDVKVEEIVRPTTRARAPEVAKASTLEEKLRRFWEAKSDVPPEERGDELIRKAIHLDETTEAA